MKRLLCLLLMTQLGLAHNFWLKPQGNRAVLFYGHGIEEIQYSKDIVKKVSGMNSDGKPAKVSWEMDDKHAVLVGTPEVAQMGAEIDEGYWSKTPQGWKNQSRRQAPEALASEWSLSYSKVLLKPGACLNRPFGHKLEIVPVSLEGKTIHLRVLLDGKPLPKAPLSDGHKKAAETDSHGEATVAYEGPTVYSVQDKEPLANSPEAETYKLRAVLSLP